ncbi:MAG TPA: hypothetical protein VFO19_20170 [Vicinamibacterales bacterium]|nr:hypothetical protein [Vicinamibacterales bacterium]
MLPTSDRAFLSAFEGLELAGADFSHRSHIRYAWLVRRVAGADAARDRIERGIRAFAEAQGAAAKYHVTITEAWVRLVEAAIASDPPDERETFDAWVARHAPLLDSSRLAQHFSLDRLRSEPARIGWVEPDLASLPPRPAR